MRYTHLVADIKRSLQLPPNTHTYSLTHTHASRVLCTISANRNQLHIGANLDRYTHTHAPGFNEAIQRQALHFIERSSEGGLGGQRVHGLTEGNLRHRVQRLCHMGV